MDINTAFPSNYLKKTDFPAPRQLIIDTVVMEDLAQDGHPADMKVVIYFNGAPKPMVANKTICMVLAAMFGPETDSWAGKQVEVFNDVTVVFNGAVGGLRVRPVTQPAAQPSPTQEFQQPTTNPAPIAEESAAPSTFDPNAPAW